MNGTTIDKRLVAKLNPYLTTNVNNYLESQKSCRKYKVLESSGNMQIMYFGKPYSFSHIAAMHRFGDKSKYISKPSIKEAIESLTHLNNSIAVVPIENTTGGIIHDTVDMLILPQYLYSNLSIVEELELNIKLFLLSKKPIQLRQIKIVYSHEYALKKAEPWIKSHLSATVTMVDVQSTSEAIHRIKNEKYSCAIASAEAADYYGLRKLNEIVGGGEEKKNITRFLVLKNNCD